MTRNCPNCGAPIDPIKIKCEYCGTICFDMSCLDLSEKTPIYLRYKTPNMFVDGKYKDAYITQLATPRLENIEINDESIDVTDSRGNVICKVKTNRSASTNIVFEAIPFGENKELFTISVVGD